LAPTAAAHVTIAPSFVAAGDPTQVAFETPNERPPRATTSLELVAPPGVDLAAVDAPDGWTLELAGSTARWSGGRIEDEDVVSFPLRITARRAPGNAVFEARQRYDDGAVVRWEATLTVVPPPGDEPDQHLGRALVAGAVGLAVLGGSFVALRLLRR
jgi:uncharacterized protein YcnI